VALSIYLYGSDADAITTREQPKWEAWLKEHFPAAPKQT